MHVPGWVIPASAPVARNATANQARAHAFLPWFLQDNVRTVRVKGASLKATDRPIDAGGLPKA
jgi:hypothetical protein